MIHKLLSALPESALDIVDATANKAHIEWEEEGREFFLHGQMYDVAYTKSMNGKTLIYCLNDTKEENLLKALGKIASGNAGNAGNNQPGQHITKFQSPDFILSELTIVGVAVPDQTINAFYRVNQLPTVTTDIPTPPPDKKSKNQTEIL